MRKFITFGFWLLAFDLLQSCSQPEPTQEELAGKAVKEYYDRLLAGDYDGFLSGKADADSLPQDYRQQLLKAYEMYQQELGQTHGGVADVTVSNVRNDEAQQLMQAFLLLHFKDSVKEEIIVPMVQWNGAWKMR